MELNAMRTKHLYLPITYCLSLFSFFIILSCGMPDGRFRVEGQFKNLNQGEFYIYDLEQGVKDTIGVRDGHFIYDVALPDTTTLILVFPNYSELPIFARPAAKVSIEGDVSHLKETEITGTKENEDMTAFRIQTNELMPPEVRKKAEEFILENPQSVVGMYLLRRYFIQGLEPDYPHALELCDTLLAHQPTYVPLVQLHKRLTTLRNAHPKGMLPTFKATDTNGKTIDNERLKSKLNVILVWASWNYDSQNMLRQVNTLQQSHEKDLSVVSICMDATMTDGRPTLERDSIVWPNICDGLMWASPLMEQLGLTGVPDNILTDRYGNILARGLKNKELKERIELLLK